MLSRDQEHEKTKTSMDNNKSKRKVSMEIFACCFYAQSTLHARNLKTELYNEITTTITIKILLLSSSSSSSLLLFLRLGLPSTQSVTLFKSEELKIPTLRFNE